MNRNLDVARRNVRQYRGRLVSLGVIIGAGCVVALTSVGLVAQAASASAHRITQGVAMRSIDILAGPSYPGATALTTDQVASLRALPHVTEVDPTAVL